MTANKPHFHMISYCLLSIINTIYNNQSLIIAESIIVIKKIS